MTRTPREKEATGDKRRLRTCVENWPACEEGRYDPRCCRFPKSCSCTIYDPELVTDSDLETESRTETMKNPTEQDMVDVYRREFPMCPIDSHERAFLAFIHIARSHGVGWGFMRQAVGLHWKEADPVGYIDDDCIRDLFTKPLAELLREARTLIDTMNGNIQRQTSAEIRDHVADAACQDMIKRIDKALE